MGLATMLRMDNSLTQAEIDLATRIWKRLLKPSGEVSPGTLTLEELDLLERFGIEDKDWELAGYLKLIHPILSRVAAVHAHARYLQTSSTGRRSKDSLELWKRSETAHRYMLRALLSLANSTHDDKLPV